MFSGNLILPEERLQFSIDLSDRKSDDSIVVAGDRVDQERAFILDAVSTGLVHRRAARDIAFDLLFLQFIETMEFHIGKSTEHAALHFVFAALDVFAVALFQDRDPGIDAVSAAGELGQHAAGIVLIFRFSEDFIFGHNYSIRADDDDAGVGRGAFCAGIRLCSY